MKHVGALRVNYEMSNLIRVLCKGLDRLYRGSTAFWKAFTRFFKLERLIGFRIIALYKCWTIMYLLWGV